MSDSVRSHRLQPTRLPRPWDSPGKNTGVGCHFLLQCMKVKSESEVAQNRTDSSRPHGLQPTRLFFPWDSPGKSIGVGCHCLLQFRTIKVLTLHFHMIKVGVSSGLEFYQNVCRENIFFTLQIIHFMSALNICLRYC